MSRTRTKNADKKIISAILVAVFMIAAVILEKTDIAYKLFDSENNPAVNTAENMTDDSLVLLDAYFIDVGQGDCALFVSDSESMLIDCGEKEAAESVLQTISQTGIKRLDYMVLTHAHSDHIGAAAEIIENTVVKNIIISQPSDNSSETGMYEEFADAVQKSGANVIIAEPNYSFTVGNANCTVLAPFDTDNDNENNNSVVMTVSAGETTFLMTGDIETSVEKEIVKKHPNLRADILKTAHHGSKTSSSADFVSAVSPEVAVISCGKENQYGHPNEKTLETFSDFGVEYYRTDIFGNIKISCTENDYSITNGK